MNNPPNAPFSLEAINRKRGWPRANEFQFATPLQTSAVARPAPELIKAPAESTRAEPTQEEAAPQATPSALKLPFDPLRLVDTLVRRWLLMVLAGVVCAGLLASVGMMKFETLHSAKAQIIKQSIAAPFRQTESGETFQPNELSITTFSSLMHSGAVAEAAALRLGDRFSERYLRSGLVIAAERNTDILNISMTSDHSPEATLEMLQAYVGEVIQLSKDLQRGDAVQMKTFLQKQMERADTDLLAVNQELLEYGREAQLLDAEKQMDAWLGELGNFSLKYETLKLDHETLDLRIQGVQKELSKVDTGAALVDNARRELDNLRVRYTNEHPFVIEAVEKLATLEQAIAKAGPRADAPPKPGESNVAESLYLELVRLRSDKEVISEQLTKLEAVRTKLNERLSQLPRKAMEYARIKTRQQALQTSLSLLTGRQREAALHEENAHGYFKLFSMARPQDVSTTSPSKKIMMAGIGGFVGGCGLVAVTLIVLTLLDPRLVTAGDLRRATGVPVIGSLAADTESWVESESAWAFRVWTRLQPMLSMNTGEATLCGLLHDAAPEAASTMAARLGKAALRRGMSSIIITTHESANSIALSSAVANPEALIRHLSMSPDEMGEIHIDATWTWDTTQRRQWALAIARWRRLTNTLILIVLPSMHEPEALVISESLPNLLWTASSAGSLVSRVQDALFLYKHAGCRLVAALLEHAPNLKPAALAKFAALLMLGMGTLNAGEILLLGPGDAVNINMPGFEGHERKEITIGPDGRLTYLQARDVIAAGLTVDQLRAKLTTALRRYYRSAKVVVTPYTFQSRKVYVLGKVVKKGAINLDRPMSLLEVVAEAGGLETGLFQQNTVELADLGRSFVMRGQQRLPLNLEALFLNGDMSQNAAIEPGDYVYFPSANSNEIYVLGDVKMQGTQGLLAHTSVHSAVALAGGFTAKAYTQRILVIRGSLDKPERIVVDMNDIMTARSKGFRLEPKDIVYIADRPWARAEELVNIAINAFLQGAVSSWTSANVGPFIKEPLLPQIR
ncbi:MAG: SLBB domain-containing protein [Verrucomicrobia bacterium]|nr:SLBB domain-containing protein [Verrucomicrobiota bacterium]